MHNDHDDVACGIDPDIAEQARCIKFADGLSGHFLGEPFTHFDRKVSENGAWLGPLYALDTNVLDDKWGEGEGNLSHGQQ